MANQSPPAHASENLGRTLAEWSFPAATPHRRGRRWYVVMGGLGVLMGVYGVWTGNFLFPVLLSLFAIVFGLVNRAAGMVRFRITERGVAIGRSFYRWSEMKKFWIIYQPPEVKNLYLEFRSAFKPRLPIPLLDQNPVTIRHLLLDYLDEDLHREDEPGWDQIGRILKL